MGWGSVLLESVLLVIGNAPAPGNHLIPQNITILLTIQPDNHFYGNWGHNSTLMAKHSKHHNGLRMVALINDPYSIDVFT